MKGHFAVRAATVADLDRIQEIEAASFGPEAYDRKLFAYYLRRCGALFLVASRGQVCGYMITCLSGRTGKPRGELVSIAIDPKSRRAGAASALLESALRRLRRRGAIRLHLVVRASNRSAQAFYQKYQFRPLRELRGYYEDGGDGISMTRPIVPPKPRTEPRP